MPDKTILSDSHKAAIARAATGRKQTEETKQKIKETLKKTFAMRKKKVIPQ